MSKTGLAWYKRESHAYLSGVQGMSMREHAVYSIALDLIYAHGGHINNDPKWIAGWISDMGPASVRRTISELVARGKLIIEGGKLTQKRAKNEAKTKEKLIENARKNGEKGGKKSAKNRGELNENNELGQACASNEKQTDKIRGDKSKKEIEPNGSLSQKVSPNAELVNLPELNLPEIKSSETKTGSGHDQPEEAASPPDPPEGGPDEDKDPGKAVELWNDLAGRYGLAGVQKLTEKRRNRLIKRLADCGGLEGWRAALERVKKSDFLLGRVGGNWCITFDFLLQDESFLRLVEGSYDNRNPPCNNNGQAGSGRGPPGAVGNAGRIIELMGELYG